MRKKLVKRESNFELLRIISMFFIIGHHLIMYGTDYDAIFSLTGINKVVVPFFRCGGKLGVALFMMITGYFMIHSKISIKKVIKLEMQVLFYSIILFLFLSIGNKVLVSGMDVLKFIFPTLMETYWFFSSYFILYLLIPWLNRLLLSLKKRDYLGLLGVSIFFLLVVKSVLIFNEQFSDIIYIIFYYIVGAYIKLFLENSSGKWKYFLGFVISYSLIILSVIGLIYLTKSNIEFKYYIYYYSGISSILVFVSSICLFLFFKNLKINNSIIVNGLSSVSFGVYLFHEHPLMRSFLWQDVLKVNSLVNGSYFVLWALLIIIVVYIIGGAYDFIRQVLFKYFDKILLKIDIYNSRFGKYFAMFSRILMLVLGLGCIF